MKPGPESRLPDGWELAAAVNADGIAGVAARFGITRDAVWVRLKRAGYRAKGGRGDRYPLYVKADVA